MTPPPKLHQVKIEKVQPFPLSVLAFNTGIYFVMGKEKALEFLGGYVIEQSLSIDNLFLFLLIFGSFNIPVIY